MEVWLKSTEEIRKLSYCFFLQKTGDIPKELLKHKEFCDRLIVMSQNPPTLQQLCRVKIRYQLGTSPIQKLHDLKMPRQLKDFVALKEFD